MADLISRRKFLCGAAGAGAFAACGGFAKSLAQVTSDGSGKVIIILFGGGTRSRETIDDPSHRYIPHLWKEMVPKGTLFTNMRVEGKVVHPNSAGSIMTGFWEWDDLDWTRPVANPTIFEIYRKAYNQPDTDTWAFVYASILANTGKSLAPGFGEQYAANVVVPPTISRKTHEKMSQLMQEAKATGSNANELAAIERGIEMAKKESKIDFSYLRSNKARKFMQARYGKWKDQGTSTSHDEFLTDCTIACMEEFAPSVIAVDFGEIDCAHYGSWSRYTDAIARTDVLTHRIWESSKKLDSYKENTLFLILPDHGREEGEFGFVHHSDFYTGRGTDESCRKVWMLALGNDIKKGNTIGKPTPITTAASTAMDYLGLKIQPNAAKSVFNELSNTFVL